MLKRNIYDHLLNWKQELTEKERIRKPLVVRGARQVGKSFIIREFAKSEFKNYIELNLDQSDDLALFANEQSIENLILAIELKTKQQIIPGQTIVFIDEIQNSKIAVKALRYFFEKYPKLHVIAAGSLLDVYLHKNKFEIPVGRVEYCYLHPLTFEEFLVATNDHQSLEIIKTFAPNKKVDDVNHQLLIKKFLNYVFIGGMPEIVASYVAGESALTLERIYNSLLVGFSDDIGKYTTPSQAVYLRHCLENAPLSVGMQITYKHFADSNFYSRDISKAFDVLELAQLVTRVYSSRSCKLPIAYNKKKMPKLIFLDVGLVNFKFGQREKFLTFTQLENVFQGQISEQVVGQTLKSFGTTYEQKLSYWYRDKKGSNAEVDYLCNISNKLIPIEVKAGSSQKIHSLYVLIDEQKQQNSDEQLVAFRIYSGKPNIKELKTIKGNAFTLISLPYYMLFRLEEIVRLIYTY